MRLQRKLMNKEWKEIVALGPGVRMYKGKKTLFYNGEELYDQGSFRPLIYNWEERESWEVIIVLPGVEIISRDAFKNCTNLKVVIMADSVRRIEMGGFFCCTSLDFIKLSRNLDYIGRWAFRMCHALTSIFIPPSCRQIVGEAFDNCKRLIILSIPQNIQVGEKVFQYTALIKKSPIETDEDGYYISDNEGGAVRWIKSINNEEAYALHRVCSSYNPLAEIIHDLVKRQGIKAMRMKNAIGVTPSQYLEANKFAEISEKDIMNRYISEMMGEVF